MLLEKIASHIICLYNICLKLPPPDEHGVYTFNDGSISCAGGLVRKISIPSIYTDKYIMIYLNKNFFDLSFIEEQDTIVVNKNLSSTQKRQICEFNLKYLPDDKIQILSFCGGNISKKHIYRQNDQIQLNLIIEFFEYLEFKQKMLEDLEIFLSNWCLELV